MQERPVIHGDELAGRAFAAGDIAFARKRLGYAAGAIRIGASRFVVDPGARQMPVHVHGDEEEIFFVLAGSGLSWQADSACTVTPGDVIVHRPRGAAHT